MDETILVNYLQGECNDEEAARVEAWCEEGPENRKTLEKSISIRWGRYATVAAAFLTGLVFAGGIAWGLLSN